MDFRKIPAVKSIYIKDGFYDLLFEVENAALLSPPFDEIMGDAHGNDDDANNGDGNSSGLENTGGDHQDLANGANVAASIPGTGMNSSDSGFSAHAPNNSRTVSSGVIFSPSLMRSMADSKREFLAAVCAAQKSDVSETRKTCTDGTLRNPKSPNLVPAPVVISRVAAPVKATHVAASSEAMHVSKDMHFVASPKAMHDSNLMGSPHMADRADTGKDPTAAVAAAEATALAGNSSSDARSVFANKAAPRMVEAEAALEVPTAGAAAVLRRSVTPLRSSHASRSGRSPHAGTLVGTGAPVPARKGL
jgi:hypothetical protein